MSMETIRLRRAALGCVLDAWPRWRNKGIRIANHPVRVNGEHREWLTVFGKDGSLLLWEHFPESRLIGRIAAGEVGRGERVSPHLVRKLNGLFS